MSVSSPSMPAGTGATAQTLPPYRWVILLVAFMALITGFIVRLAWGNASVAVRDGLSLNAPTLGAFVTAFYVGYVVSNMLGGFAADRIGPRRALTFALVPLGLFTFSFGSFAVVWQGLALQALMGLSAGLNFASTTKVVSAWFPPSYRGRAFGLLATASSFPVIIANALFPTIIQIFSWGMLYRGLGLLSILVGVACFFLLRDAPPRHAAGAETAAALPRIGEAVRRILCDRDLLIFAVAGFGGQWGTWGFAFWSNALMVKGHGFTPVQAGAIVALFGLGAVIAKPLYGFLSDWLGGRRKHLIALCYLCFAVMLLIFGAQSSETGFELLAPLLGVTAFAYNPLQTAMLSELIGKNSVGAAAGLSNALWQLGSMIVPVAVGYAFDLTASFSVAFLVLALGPLLGAISMMFVREAKQHRPAATV